MSDHVQPVTDETFEEEVLKSDKPVLVDFWAPWCAPCRMLTPIVDEVAQEFSDQAKVLNLNVDENSETSAKYNIKSKGFPPCSSLTAAKSRISSSALPPKTISPE
jgi:thioredoxin 1